MLSPEALVEDNLKLVYYLVHKYRYEGMEFDEQVSLGMLGLWKAARKFNPERGAFSSYASKIIINEWRMQIHKLRRMAPQVELEDRFFVGLSRNVEEEVLPKLDLEFLAKSLKPVEREICACLASGMTQDEAAKRMGISQSYVSRTVKRMRRRVEDAV